MLRFIAHEIDVGAACNVGGPIEKRLRTFDGDVAALEAWLRFGETEGRKPEYVSRELIGVEIVTPNAKVSGAGTASAGLPG